MSSRLELLQKMVDQGSTDPFHGYALALEHRSMNALQKALDTFDQVAQQFPTYVPTYLMAAQVAQELGKSEAAKDWTTRGIETATREHEDHALSELRQFLETL